MPSLSTFYKLYKTYEPDASKRPKAQSNIDRSFGPFKPCYVAQVWRAPRTDDEAQKLYNHARTMAFLMDASPLLSDLGLPFKAGLDDVISLVPLYGDLLAAVLSLYNVYVAFLFGLPWSALAMMIVNTLIDFVVGLVPVIGDILDNLWKANLKNLRIMEDHLLADKRFNILLMPLGNDFLPPTTPAKGSGGSWFARKAKEDGRTPFVKGRRSRRMEAWEGSAAGAGGTSGERAQDDAGLDLD